MLLTGTRGDVYMVKPNRMSMALFLLSSKAAHGGRGGVKMRGRGKSVFNPDTVKSKHASRPPPKKMRGAQGSRPDSPCTLEGRLVCGQ